jgi:hypothetical protein
VVDDAVSAVAEAVSSGNWFDEMAMSFEFEKLLCNAELAGG